MQFNSYLFILAVIPGFILCYFLFSKINSFFGKIVVLIICIRGLLKRLRNSFVEQDCSQPKQTFHHLRPRNKTRNSILVHNKWC